MFIKGGKFRPHNVIYITQLQRRYRYDDPQRQSHGSTAMVMFGVEGLPPRPVRRGSRDDSVEEADAVLMHRVATADRSAMHILFSRHHLAVYRFVLQRLQDRALAEDVTSEAFLEVWRRAGRFDGRSPVVAWILAIARHKTFAAQPERHLRIDGASATGADGENIGQATPMQAPDRHTVLRGCMKKLPAEHREVIDLVYYQEQSMEAVAAILGIPRRTARTRVSYARRRLAAELKKSGVDWIAP
jgi:RNA polymerase sigma-70 factor, ECF subfamily